VLNATLEISEYPFPAEARTRSPVVVTETYSGVAPFPESATLFGLTLQAAASRAPPPVKEMLPLKPGPASPAARTALFVPSVPHLPSKRSTPMAKVEKALRRFRLVPPSAAILRHHQ
jgi:hypothetical protein